MSWKLLAMRSYFLDAVSGPSKAGSDRRSRMLVKYEIDCENDGSVAAFNASVNQAVQQTVFNQLRKEKRGHISSTVDVQQQHDLRQNHRHRFVNSISNRLQA